MREQGIVGVRIGMEVVAVGAMLWGCGCGGSAPVGRFAHVGSVQSVSAAARLNSVLVRRAALIGNLPGPLVHDEEDGKMPAAAERELKSASTDAGCAAALRGEGNAGAKMRPAASPAAEQSASQDTTADETERGRLGRMPHGEPDASKALGDAGGNDGKRNVRTWEEQLKDALGPSSEEERVEQVAKARKALAVRLFHVLYPYRTTQ